MTFQNGGKEAHRDFQEKWTTLYLLLLAGWKRPFQLHLMRARNPMLLFYWSSPEPTSDQGTIFDTPDLINVRAQLFPLSGSESGHGKTLILLLV